MSTSKRIQRIIGPIGDINEGQIGIEDTVDPLSLHKMFGYQDADGNVFRVVCQGEKAVVSSVSSSGDVIGQNIFKANFAATGDPTVSNDFTQGYVEGSVWFNNASGAYFVCVDSSGGAAQWDQLNLSGALVSGVGNGSVRNPSSVTTTADADFSISQGQNIPIDSISVGAAGFGKDNYIASSPGALVSGHNNSCGWRETAVDGSWVFTRVGDNVTLEGPNWPFPVYDTSSPYWIQRNLAGIRIIISDATSIANWGYFVITQFEDGVLTFKNSAGVSENSIVGTKVKFAGNYYSSIGGYGNFVTGSDYCLVQGYNCHVLNAPFSRTFGSGSHNQWAGSTVTSNGAMALSSGATSGFGIQGQTISNVRYSGEAEDRESTYDLAMFFDGSVSGITIDNYTNLFRLRNSFTYYVQARVTAQSGDQYDDACINREYTFAIRPTASSFEIVDLNEDTRSLTAASDADSWLLVPSITQQVLAGNNGNTTFDYLLWTADTRNILNWNFETAPIVGNGWTVGANTVAGEITQSSTVPPGATEPTTFSCAISPVSGSNYRSIWQNVFTDGVEYTVELWSFLSASSFSTLYVECSGSTEFTTTTRTVWENPSWTFTATSNPRMEIFFNGDPGEYALVDLIKVTDSFGVVQTFWDIDLQLVEVGQDA
jgi:hypothetical protein